MRGEDQSYSTVCFFQWKILTSKVVFNDLNVVRENFLNVHFTILVLRVIWKNFIRNRRNSNSLRSQSFTCGSTCRKEFWHLWNDYESQEWIKSRYLCKPISFLCIRHLFTSFLSPKLYDIVQWNTVTVQIIVHLNVFVLIAFLKSR